MACVGCAGRQTISSHQTKPKQTEVVGDALKTLVSEVKETLSKWATGDCYLLPVYQRKTFKVMTLLEHLKGNGKQALTCVGRYQDVRYLASKRRCHWFREA